MPRCPETSEIDRSGRFSLQYVHMSLDNRSRRREPRTAQREAVWVTLATAPLQARSAILVDRSESGLGIRLAAQVHIGQEIAIESATFRGAGVVRWVAMYGGLYSAGVALIPQTAVQSHPAARSLSTHRVA